MTNPDRRAIEEWRRGWPIVLASLVGLVGSIAPTYTIGQFIKPLSALFGWSRAEITGVTAFNTVSMLAFGTLVGAMVDRYGPRRIGLIGVPLTGICYAAIGLAGPSIWSWYAAWGVFAVVFLGIGPMVWTPAIARQFDTSRGFALAVGYCGSGIGAAFWPPLTLWLIDTLGWRGAFAAIGLGIAIVATVVVMIFFRGPATAPRAPAQAEESPELDGASLAEALRSSIFWRIAIMMMASAGAVFTISIHLPALLNDRGLSVAEAAWVAAAIGPSLIVGRLAVGVALDRFPARYVTATTLLMPAIAAVLLIGYHGSLPRALAAAIFNGMAAGAEGDVLAYLISRYFGLRRFGAIYGAGLTGFGVGFGLGPSIGGLIFDKFGSYEIGLTGLAILLVACAATALTFGRYPGYRSTL